MLLPWNERVATAGRARSESRAAAVATLAPLFERRAADLGLAAGRLTYEPSLAVTRDRRLVTTW
ncbi:MAG TPA: hypothetical protein VH721_05485 [Gaiellaceae bacterium]